MNKILLLSGGLDSVVCLAENFKDIGLCLCVDYGQEHDIEIKYAKYWAELYNVAYNEIKIPKIEKSSIVEYSFRNSILLSVACSIAKARNFTHVIIGCNDTDRADFVDCKHEFIETFNQISSMQGIKIDAPLLYKNKMEILRIAKDLNIDLNLVWSCYMPDENKKPCGKCLSCTTRSNAYVQNK